MRQVDTADIALLALVSHLQHQLFLSQDKTPELAERLTRRVINLAYQMAFGEAINTKTHDAIDKATQRLVDAVKALEDLIEEEEKALKK